MQRVLRRKIMRTKMIKNQAMLLLLENFAKYSQSSGYCQFAFQLFVLWKKFILEFSFFSLVYFKNAHNEGSNRNFAKFSLFIAKKDCAKSLSY